jgi:NAD(P)-dependent dehydrogenase (short-subunit alcohol dehydrogenase family)
MTLESAIGDLDYTHATGLSIMSPYCISKAALNMVVAKYAAQYKEEGIIFVTVCPGLVDTGPIAP